MNLLVDISILWADDVIEELIRSASPYYGNVSMLFDEIEEIKGDVCDK